MWYGSGTYQSYVERPYPGTVGEFLEDVRQRGTRPSTITVARWNAMFKWLESRYKNDDWIIDPIHKGKE